MLSDYAPTEDTMFDIHCHILSGVDDGSDSLKESVRMAEMALERGTTAIIATPHCNIPDSFQNYIDFDFMRRFDELRQAVEDEYLAIDIYPGQEIFCTGRTLGFLKEGKLLTLNRSRYPLVEFEFGEYSSAVYRKLSELVAEGYVPVVAHPERYSFVSEDENAAAKLKEIGCLLQVNKGSLFGRFGRGAEQNAHDMLRHRLADFIASDAHSPYMRTPVLDDTHEYISEYYSVDYADFLLDENPEHVILDKKIMTY